LEVELKIMKKLLRVSRFTAVLVVFLVINNSVFTPTRWGFSSEARAQPGMGKMGGMAAMSREQQMAHHEKMIEMHTKMLACLKSTKTVEECHKEMMAACEGIHGGTCPMPMMGHHGGMHNPAGMKQGGSAKDSVPKK
jgi:hypothetical protein